VSPRCSACQGPNWAFRVNLSERQRIRQRGVEGGRILERKRMEDKAMNVEIQENMFSIAGQHFKQCIV